MATATATADTLKKQLDALNRHDVPTFASCYASNAEVVDPAYPEPLRGEAIKRDMTDFIAAFPDLQGSVERTIESGDTAAYEMKMRGTHKGPLVVPTGHIPATNRKVDFRGAIFARLDSDGRIVEERRYYDVAGLLDQLGQLQ